MSARKAQILGVILFLAGCPLFAPDEYAVIEPVEDAGSHQTADRTPDGASGEAGSGGEGGEAGGAGGAGGTAGAGNKGAGDGNCKPGQSWTCDNGGTKCVCK